MHCSLVLVVALSSACGSKPSATVGSGGQPTASGGATATGAATAAGGTGGTAQTAGRVGGSTGGVIASSGGASTATGGGGTGGLGGTVASAGMPATAGSGASDACSNAGVEVPQAERKANGNPLLPPKWAFGILWGSYYDQVGSTYAQGGNILTAATKLRAEYSGDLMWIDSSWLWHEYSAGGQYYICFAFDPAGFPDPGAMIATLRQNHFHFGVWEWPWMGHGCKYFQDGVTNKYFVMNGSQPAATTGAWHGDTDPAAFDYTNPATVTWWSGLNKPLSDWGLDFMKLDTSTEQHDSPFTTGSGKLFDAAKNYAHEYYRAAYEVTKLYASAHDAEAKRNSARGFILPKTVNPGGDQVPGWWTDDIKSTWAGMITEMTRASKLNAKDTAAYWCGDTGGYFDVPTDELYIRWLEYSTFTPLQEFFGAKSPGIGARFPWLFSAQAQAIQKQYAALRYRLLPFRYSNAQRAYHVTPVQYPVTWIGQTQLLVGGGASQLLLQPVTAAGVTSATVKLPAGGKWIHYWTGAEFDGGVSATVAAPLDQVPLFVKAGSIIPMGPAQKWVDEVPADPLTLDIYPAGATGYTLYEDDGVSEGYLGGAYATTQFKSDDTSGQLVISIGAQAQGKYGYAGRICSRGYVLKVNGRASAPASVTRNGKTEPAVTAAAFGAAAEGWYYDSASRTVWVKFTLLSTSAAQVTL